MKINIETTLEKQGKTTKNTYSAIRSDNTIIYQEPNCVVKIIMADDVKMIRENNEFKFELHFSKEKTSNSYLLKETNTVLDMVIETKVLEINENAFYLEYSLNDEDCIFSLRIGE